MTTKEREAELDKRLAERVDIELNAIDYESAFAESLDESYSFASVGGPFEHMQPSAVLKEMDPTAFRCGANDYADSMCRDGAWEYIAADYYQADEVEEIRAAIEEELDSEEEEED